MINKLFKFVDKNTGKIIFVLAILLGMASYIYFYNQGLITAFGDSKGHLNIARRVLDSLTPGAAQLGAYWLPFLHILMLPTIGLDFMWRTGLSGTIPNILAYGFSAVYIYKTVKLFTGSKINATLATFALLLNPNFIYMSATPMTEGIFVLTVLGATYHFYKWVRTDKIPQLILAGAWVFLSTLTRYEGWAVAAIITSLLIFQWLIHRFSTKWEGKIILFSIIAWLGIVLWISWGALIVHDPLDFLHNSMSAINQTKETFDLIKATGSGFLPGAVLTNILAFKHIAGLGAIILVFIVAFWYVIKYRKNILDIKYIFLVILFAPIIFDIVSVYLGNVPVEVPELSKVPPPGNYFNIRYAVFSLPVMCFLAFSVSKKWIVNFLVFLLIVLSYVSLILPGSKLVVLNEAGITSLGLDYSQSTNWFKQNYDNGLVLASTGAADGFMYDVGKSLSIYVVEGSYKYWDKALIEPEKYVKWIITDPSNVRDAVNKKIDKNKLNKYYSLAFQQYTFTIFKRNDQR